MSNPIRITKTLDTADANGIAVAQTLAGAGDVDLDGVFVVAPLTYAVLDTPRRVIITSAGNDSGITFTVYGNQRVDGTGNDQVEVVQGVNIGAASTLLDFGTVTRVAASGATAGDIEVGTNGVGGTPWFNVDYQMHPITMSIAVVVTGTVNYTVQYTYDDIAATSSQPNAATPIYVTFNDPVLTSETANGESNFSSPFTAWRVVVNSGTGSIAVTGIQGGIQG